jgi:hypothetical protein
MRSTPGSNTPDLDVVYQILREWAAGGTPRFYKDLSNAYHAKTGDWHEPHGSWDEPLGAINNRLEKTGAPALSALVVLKGDNEPGAKFWGCAPNVPGRPNDPLARVAVWDRIVKDVIAFKWPEKLP